MDPTAYTRQTSTLPLSYTLTQPLDALCITQPLPEGEKNQRRHFALGMESS